METLSQTKYVMFDKTGTLTKGAFEVSAVHHNELEEEKLLEYAALAECASSHPISKSLQKHTERKLTETGFRISGKSAVMGLQPSWTVMKLRQVTTS